MPGTVVAEAAVNTATFAPAPYQPAALSRILAWIDGLPMHGWWAYPLLAVLLVAWSQAVLWATGQVPTGSVQVVIAEGMVYGPFILAALNYVNRVSERALARFWPATGWPESDQAAWRYAFVTSPGGFGIAAIVFGFLVAMGAFFGYVNDTSVAGIGRTALLAAYLPGAVLGYGLVLAATVHVVRQLRLVAQIHREATRIDPFDRVPVYAFSSLTARAGLMYVAAGFYASTVQASFQTGNAVAIPINAISFVIGVACFVLPLWGIHERLGREKDALLREVEARVGRLGEEMFRRIDAGEFDGTKVVSEALAGAGALRDRINRLPTWPWPPNLLRGFISALLLPVVVYIVTRGIGGRIGL